MFPPVLDDRRRRLQSVWLDRRPERVVKPPALFPDAIGRRDVRIGFPGKLEKLSYGVDIGVAGRVEQIPKGLCRLQVQAGRGRLCIDDVATALSKKARNVLGKAATRRRHLHSGRDGEFSGPKMLDRIRCCLGDTALPERLGGKVLIWRTNHRISLQRTIHGRGQDAFDQEGGGTAAGRRTDRSPEVVGALYAALTHALSAQNNDRKSPLSHY